MFNDAPTKETMNFNLGPIKSVTEDRSSSCDEYFLELIRPMIMNQVSYAVSNVMDGYMEKMQSNIQTMMSSQLTFV